MLDIFFSNKIPSTNDGWTDELIRVASIFEEFDGLPFSYEDIVDRFATISNRYPDARDEADYRDEYGAYASYLGLMHYEQDLALEQWTCRVPEQSKILLCGVLPDPEAFMRLRLSLFQYPNPIGTIYHENGTLHAEPLSLRKRVELAQNGVRTVPFRLILGVLLSLADQFDRDQAYLTYPEIWACLFTQVAAVGTEFPNYEQLAISVMDFRQVNPNGTGVNIPSNALRNLHIFRHTGLIVYREARRNNQRRLELIPEACDPSTQLGKIARTIANLNLFFPVPDRTATEDEIKQWTLDTMESGDWARYYSGDSVSLESANLILQPVTSIADNLFNPPGLGFGAALVELQGWQQEQSSRARKRTERRANPEETEILRERANLKHREMVNLIASRLRALGEIPLFNDFIDVATTTPGNEKLFEIKSCRPENLLSQVRKGVSQLYEYRYRHPDLQDGNPVLVLEQRPENELEWVIDYLINDRQIMACWLEGDDTLAAPASCEAVLGQLANRYEP